MPGQAFHQAGGQEAEPPPGAVHQVQFFRVDPHRLEHRWLRPGFLHPDHGVDQLLGVLDEVERPPGGIDQWAGHLDQVWCQELAELGDRLGERLPAAVSDRLQQCDRVVIAIGAGREIRARRPQHARPAAARVGGRGEPVGERLRELLDKEKDQPVHDADLSEDGLVEGLP